MVIYVGKLFKSPGKKLRFLFIYFSILCLSSSFALETLEDDPLFFKADFSSINACQKEQITWSSINESFQSLTTGLQQVIKTDKDEFDTCQAFSLHEKNKNVFNSAWLSYENLKGSFYQFFRTRKVSNFSYPFNPLNNKVFNPLKRFTIWNLIKSLLQSARNKRRLASSGKKGVMATNQSLSPAEWDMWKEFLCFQANEFNFKKINELCSANVDFNTLLEEYYSFGNQPYKFLDDFNIFLIGLKIELDKVKEGSFKAIRVQGKLGKKSCFNLGGRKKPLPENELLPKEILYFDRSPATSSKIKLCPQQRVILGSFGRWLNWAADGLDQQERAELSRELRGLALPNLTIEKFSEFNQKRWQ